MKKFIAHIVPSMNIGGVEVAVYRSYEAINEKVDYRVFYVRRKGVLRCGQEPVWKLFYHMIRNGQRPDVVITSLWWAHPVGWLLQAWSVSWIAFFHSSGYSHIADKLLLRWAWKNSAFRLVDSVATGAAMGIEAKRSTSLVPYVFPANGPVVPWVSRDVDFVWTGRAAAVKRIDLLIKFLSLAEGHFNRGRVIIAIAGQVPASLSEFASTSCWIIEFKQNLPNADVLVALGRAKFYLLFSDHEGMSMSTVEAVQAGCVAVVRRVGEISRYLDESACISIRDDSTATLESVALSTAAIAHDPHAAETMRARALLSISRIPHYSSSLLTAILSVIKSR